MTDSKMSYRVVRFAEANDTFDRIYHETFGQDLGVHRRPGDDDLFLEALDNDRLMGWLVIEPRQDKATGYISYGGILPHARNQKGAAEQMNVGLDLAQTFGMKLITLVVKRDNIPMQVLALKVGFHIQGMLAGRDGNIEVLFERFREGR